MSFNELENKVNGHCKRITSVEETLKTLVATSDSDVAANPQGESFDTVMAGILKEVEAKMDDIRKEVADNKEQIAQVADNYKQATEAVGKLMNGYLAQVNEVVAKYEDQEKAFDSKTNKILSQYGELAGYIQADEEAHKGIILFQNEILKRQNEVEERMKQITAARTAPLAALYSKVSAKTVCDLFDISRKTLTQWVAEGKISNYINRKGVAVKAYFPKEQVVKLFTEGNFTINPKRFK